MSTLVDGQQRMTTLFLLFQFLETTDLTERVEINYEVREDSQKYLKDENSVKDKDIQDIYFFVEAKKIISRCIEEGLEESNNEEGKKKFSAYIQNHVKLLVNEIPDEKALSSFIALNGLKAIMKDEELIKSDLLIKSSRKQVTVETEDDAKEPVENVDDAFEEIKKIIGHEWKTNEDRSILARNWDKWLYWWNQDEVRDFFGIRRQQHPLFYLLVTFWNITNSDKKKTFDFVNFKNLFIRDYQTARESFEKLRKLQKSFEDFYNDPERYNMLGFILKTSNAKEDPLLYFLKNRDCSEISLEEYAKWSLVGATHSQILGFVSKEEDDAKKENEAEKETPIDKAEEAIALVNEKFVYSDENGNKINDNRKEFAYKFLLLLNMLEDQKLKRKFDFSIWNNRSLEHIHPQSKADELNFDEVDGCEEIDKKNVSVHSIGNLVLLYGKNNSEFGANDFDEKKSIFFNEKEFKSRHLLHTISVFANSKWDAEEIIKNKKIIINSLKKYYGIE